MFPDVGSLNLICVDEFLQFGGWKQRPAGDFLNSRSRGNLMLQKGGFRESAAWQTAEMWTAGLLAVSYAGEFLCAIKLKYVEEIKLFSCVKTASKWKPCTEIAFDICLKNAA